MASIRVQDLSPAAQAQLREQLGAVTNDVRAAPVEPSAPPRTASIALMRIWSMGCLLIAGLGVTFGFPAVVSVAVVCSVVWWAAAEVVRVLSRGEG